MVNGCEECEVEDILKLQVARCKSGAQTRAHWQSLVLFAAYRLEDCDLSLWLPKPAWVTQ